jgi:ribonuclease HII
MLCMGIDEAGYGPTLGPLCVVSVQADCADDDTLRSTFAAAATGVRDSKQLHRPGDLAPLETVARSAVGWLVGAQPATAASLFALLGEQEEDRGQAPWMAGAAELALPVARSHSQGWSLPGIRPLGVAGRIVHPRAYSRSIGSGSNKAELELELVSSLLAGMPRSGPSTTVVDRLGGRRYYRDLVQRSWGNALVLIEEEGPLASRYLAEGPGGPQRVAFLVDGESASPLTAIASCIAKYARELHMLLLNRWFVQRQPGLRPTAGYPEDAKRWLAEIASADRLAFAELLVRTERARP